MKAVFIDRDGTINEDSSDRIKSWNEFRFLPGVKNALALLNSGGFPVFIITNQAGVAYGLLTESGLNAIHEKMKKEIEKEGGHISGIYYCIHHPDDKCICRKPKAGLLEKAALQHKLDLSGSYMIGDKSADIEAGRHAGCRTILVKTGYGSSYSGPEPDFVTENLLEAAKIITNRSGFAPKTTHFSRKSKY